MSEEIQARTSSRARNKSQRALESEDTRRLLVAAKARAKAAEAQEQGQPSSSVKASIKAKGKKAKSKSEVVKKEPDVFCICKTGSDHDGGPMIECAECRDWFHFSCVNLTEDEAERIHTYICPNCSDATDKTTIHTFDISTIRSPSPLGSSNSVPKAKRRRTNDVDVEIPDPSSSASSDSGEEASIHSNSDTNSDSGSGSGSEQGSKRPKSVKREESKFKVPARPSRTIDPARKRTTPMKREDPNFKVPGRSSGNIDPARKRWTAAPTTLPPARQFVLDKLKVLIKAVFFGLLDGDELVRYVAELEEALFENFKDGHGPKATAGSRYKTQFNLLDRSLPKARADIIDSIILRALPPSGIATLTSADLASEERLQELEQAKRTALEQTVKVKSDADDVGAVRLGRDGFEKVEDAREKEMLVLARQEEDARRRNSITTGRGRGSGSPDIKAGSSALESPGVRNDIGRSPIQPPESPHSQGEGGSATAAAAAPVHRRSELLSGPSGSAVVDTAIQSPSLNKSSFALTSAWGSGGAAAGAGAGPTLPSDDLTPREVVSKVDVPVSQDEYYSLGDQSVLDLSDIIGHVDGHGLDLDLLDGFGDEGEDNSKGKEKGKEKGTAEGTGTWAEYVNSPVVWTGGLQNPTDNDPPPPTPILARSLHTLPDAQPSWSVILPRDPIVITGRVPTKASSDFIKQVWENDMKEVVFVVLSLGSDTEKDKRDWEGLMDFFINKDRHAVYHAYGTKPENIPSNGAREIYFIPLRPTDPLPSFISSILGLSIPTERNESIFIGAIMGNRGFTSRPNTVLVPVPAPPPAAPVPAPDMPVMIPNAKLQELMATLNSGAISALAAGGISPLQPPTPIAYAGTPDPYSTPAPITGYGNAAPLPPNAQAYPPLPAPTQHGYGYENHHAQPSHGVSGRDRDRDPRASRRDQDWETQRDNGWGNRGGGGGGARGRRY